MGLLNGQFQSEVSTMNMAGRNTSNINPSQTKNASRADCQKLSNKTMSLLSANEVHVHVMAVRNTANDAGSSSMPVMVPCLNC